MDYRTLVFLSLVTLLFSCGSETECGEVSPYYSTQLKILLINAETGDYLVDTGIEGGIFHPSISKIYQLGTIDTTEITNPIDINDWISRDSLVLNNLYSLHYELDLVTFNGKHDIDTLDINYIVTQEECGELLTYVEIYYNLTEEYIGSNLQRTHPIRLTKI